MVATERRVSELVSIEDLMCPGCEEGARPEGPAYWVVAWGLPAHDFSHLDGSALCQSRETGIPAEPVERDRW